MFHGHLYAHGNLTTTLTTKGMNTGGHRKDSGFYCRSRREETEVNKQTPLRVCHYVALAVIGWYLMVPPPDVATGAARTSAPYSEWLQGEHFETIGECQKFKEQVTKDGPAAYRTSGVDDRRLQRLVAGDRAARCISDDDPHLKER